MIKTCVGAGVLVLRAGRVLFLLVAAVLVAGSIATSLARPAAKSVPIEDAFTDDAVSDAAHMQSGAPAPVALDETSVPSAVTTDAPAPGSIMVSQALVWNAGTGAWAEPAALTAGGAGFQEGDDVPVLVRIGQTVAGMGYQVTLDYSDCGFAYSAAFDSLSPVSGTTAQVTPPGPGRARPDSTISVPPPHAGNPGAAVLAWGATFSGSPSGDRASVTCDEDAIVVLDLLARGNEVWLVFSGHLRATNISPTVAHSFAPLPILVERTP